VVTGRVIQGRYLLQRVVVQDSNCAVYQGFDQVLQRAVAVKVPSAEIVPAYRASVRATSQFAHPNIIGTYDLVADPDHLYLVQEFVDGDNFQTLLHAQMPLQQVVDLGVQICQALLFASSPPRKVCHGDLTPSAILRDRRGLVRVNNFALPSDMQYFTVWNTLGGTEQVLADHHLPSGQVTAGRQADDTRAVGLLLYQLLTSRATGTTPGEPPADGRMRFMRNVPAELCEVVARAVIHQHPQYISSADTLLAELRTISDALEPAPVEVAVAAGYQTEEVARGAQPFSAVPSGRLAISTPTREAVTESAATAYAPDPRTANMLPDFPLSSATPVDWAGVPQRGYAQEMEAKPQHVNVLVLLGIGIVLFALFFVIGLFLAHALLGAR
jgi:serine/threonine protein kinase